MDRRMPRFLIGSEEKFVFIGDSITDCGRRGEHAPLGNGYVSIAVNLATAKYPERKIRWVNKGISGDTVGGLVARWTRDVLDEKPDWVSIAIGINDVARDSQSGRPWDERLRGFENAYRKILERTAYETEARIVVFEVFYLKEEDELSREFNVDPYNQVIHRLAEEYKAILVPVYQAFKRASSKRPGLPWTRGDGVHPLPAGHALIALEFLKAMGW
jgi:lysophospholipase L1-like esterase